MTQWSRKGNKRGKHEQLYTRKTTVFNEKTVYKKNISKNKVKFNRYCSQGNLEKLQKLYEKNKVIAEGGIIDGNGLQQGAWTYFYPDGKVIFDSPISSSASVKLNYSYKWVKVDKAEGVPFFRQIQNNDFKIDNNFLTGSGDWVQLGQT